MNQWFIKKIHKFYYFLALVSIIWSEKYKFNFRSNIMQLESYWECDNFHIKIDGEIYSKPKSLINSEISFNKCPLF